MRRVLILGGTGWLGREIARAAIAEGAAVTALARGESGAVPDGARLVRADRLRPGAYAGLAGDWDEIIELAVEPGLVGPALDALAAHAAHWTLVSSVSVYANNDSPLADETAAVVEPVDPARYADAKVAAERLSRARLRDRLLIARPGLIVGPGDPSDRFGYWPARLHRGGRAVTPETEGRFVQAIDVADLAGWIERAGRAHLIGVVNAVGAIHPLEGFLRELSAATRFRGELVSIDDAALLAGGVQYWAGPRSLPLWLPLSDAAFAQRDGAAYLASGGTHRPLRETLARTLEDEIARGLDRPRRAGLTAAEENAVLERRSVTDG